MAVSLSVISRCPVCSTEFGLVSEGVDIKCPICGFISAYTRTKAEVARKLTFQVAPFAVKPLTTEFVVTETSFTIRKGAYSGSFSGLAYPTTVIPGTKFSADGSLIKGNATNSSSVALSIRIRVIDLAKSAPDNIVTEETVATSRPAGNTFGWWLPAAGGNQPVMPNKDWTLQLQMLGYY